MFFFSINPVKNMTSFLRYQSWLSVVMLLKGKNLLFWEYYYMKTWTGKNTSNLQKTKKQKV